MKPATRARRLEAAQRSRAAACRDQLQRFITTPGTLVIPELAESAIDAIQQWLAQEYALGVTWARATVAEQRRRERAAYRARGPR